MQIDTYPKYFRSSSKIPKIHWQATRTNCADKNSRSGGGKLTYQLHLSQPHNFNFTTPTTTDFATLHTTSSTTDYLAILTVENLRIVELIDPSIVLMAVRKEFADPAQGPDTQMIGKSPSRPPCC